MKLHCIVAASLAICTAQAPALAQDTQPAAAQSEIDPARLAAAQTTVQAIFPPGTYARIMKSSMDAIMGPMMDQVQDMPLRDIAGMTGMKDEDLSKLGKGTIREVMTILDPAFRERTDLSMRTMMGEISTIMTRFEPGFREGLAQAYAKRFSVAQLADLNRFFATPTGAAYGAESMTLFTDPAVMAKMQEMMPQLLKEMPALVGKVQSATAGLPKPRKFEDLSSAERAKLARLLGVSESELGRKRK